MEASITANLLAGAAGSLSGSVRVGSSVRMRLAGYLDLPGGLRFSEVDQSFTFTNSQNFLINNTVYDQQFALGSTVRTVTRRSGGARAGVRFSTWSFPLVLNYDQVQQAHGDFAITMTVPQRYQAGGPAPWAQEPAAEWALSDRVQGEDTLELDPSFNFLGNSGQSSARQYEFERRGGGEPLCYERTITNMAGAVSTVSDAPHCDLLRGDGPAR